PLQVPPVIKNTWIAVDSRPVQLNHDLKTIAGAEIQRVEKSALLRVVQELCETRTPVTWLRVYGLQLEIQIDPKSAPFRSAFQRAGCAARCFIEPFRRWLRFERRGNRAEERDRDQSAARPCEGNKDGKR